MFCEVNIKNNIYNCFYETNGLKEKQPLVILHGWGVDSSIFKNITKQLNYYTITIDLIGFGKSDIPKASFKLDDYVEQVNQIINKLKLKNIKLLGHSFGGRIAIKYNYYYKLDSLILVDTAGIRHKSFKLYKQILKYKLLKKYYKVVNKEKYQNLLKNSGSRDYKMLCPVMKQTMNNVIKEDLKKFCKITRNKTLILWGVRDEETPITDGYLFHKIFFNAKIIIFYKSGHFPFLDEPIKFIDVLNRYIND